jgi:MATE family multidrug resistance protein
MNRTLVMFRELPHRSAFALAWPMIMANISVPLVGLVDTAMLGNFSNQTHLGAVALGALVMSASFWLLSFLRLGTTSLVGRALGGGRASEAASHLQRALVLGAVLSGVILLAQWVVIPLAMQVLAPDAQLASLSTTYAQIRIHSLPAMLGTLVITGYFIGAQDTRRPLLIAIGVNVINLVFDVWFVAGLRWESEGAAWASLIAEWSGLLIALVLLWKFLTDAQRARLRQWRGVGLRTGWRALLVLNSDLFIRTAALYAVMTFVTAAGGRISPEILAVNAILIQLTLLASYGLDGYAHASEAMSAKWLGARDVPAFHRATVASALPALVIALVFTGGFLILREPILAVMTNIPELVANTRTYYGWAAWLPVVSVAAYVLDGIFIGSGKSAAMRNTMLVAALGIFVPVFLGLAALAGGATNHHLWLAFTLFNASRGVLLGWVYWRLSVRQDWLT